MNRSGTWDSRKSLQERSKVFCQVCIETDWNHNHVDCVLSIAVDGRPIMLFWYEALKFCYPRPIFWYALQFGLCHRWQKERKEIQCQPLMWWILLCGLPGRCRSIYFLKTGTSPWLQPGCFAKLEWCTIGNWMKSLACVKDIVKRFR